jgi:hypothetical protein
MEHARRRTLPTHMILLSFGVLSRTHQYASRKSSIMTMPPLRPRPRIISCGSLRYLKTVTQEACVRRKSV